MNDEGLFRAIWRMATMPVRMLLIGLLWVFAADGSPVRVLLFILAVFVFVQLVQYLSGGPPIPSHSR